MGTTTLTDRLREVIEMHTARVFDTMLQVPIAPLAEPAAAPASGDDAVMALIGVTGAWTGSGSVRCSAALARRLSGQLLMTTFAAVDADVLDAMGEIANMIIGNVKEDVAPELGPLGISTPTVVHGAGLQARTAHGQAWSTVTFTCEGDRFEVRVCLAPAAA